MSARALPGQRLHAPLPRLVHGMMGTLPPASPGTGSGTPRASHGDEAFPHVCARDGRARAPRCSERSRMTTAPDTGDGKPAGTHATGSDVALAT